MILHLDAEHRILGAERAWELQSPHKSRGKLEWRSYKWFHSLGDAVREAARAEIRTAPVEGITEALKVVDAVIAKYTALLDGASDELASRAQNGTLPSTDGKGLAADRAAA
jgi:hypothetical protein